MRRKIASETSGGTVSARSRFRTAEVGFINQVIDLSTPDMNKRISLRIRFKVSFLHLLALVCIE